MRRYTNRCNVRSPIFDEIRHESEVSRRSRRESVILRGPLDRVLLPVNPKIGAKDAIGAILRLDENLAGFLL